MKTFDDSLIDMISKVAAVYDIKHNIEPTNPGMIRLYVPGQWVSISADAYNVGMKEHRQQSVDSLAFFTAFVKLLQSKEKCRRMMERLDKE